MKIILLVLVLTFSTLAINAQNSNTQKSKSPEMKTYLIEREIPGAGKFTPADLQAVSQKSCSVLNEMGSSIQWIHSYVTGDKIYCIYKAQNEDLIREHAKKGGFPANKIVEINTVISPETAKTAVKD